MSNQNNMVEMEEQDKEFQELIEKTNKTIEELNELLLKTNQTLESVDESLKKIIGTVMTREERGKLMNERINDCLKESNPFTKSTSPSVGQPWWENFKLS